MTARLRTTVAAVLMPAAIFVATVPAVAARATTPPVAHPAAVGRAAAASASMSVVPSRPIKIRADKKVVKKAPARTAAVSRYRKLPSRVTRLNWHALAACESGGRPGAVSRNGKYRGMYQFSVGTWRGVGGRGLPNKASKVEQTYRAQLLFMRRGAAPWPVCGKRLYR